MANNITIQYFCDNQYSERQSKNDIYHDNGRSFCILKFDKGQTVIKQHSSAAEQVSVCILDIHNYENKLT